jgi:hypothetical protein
LNRWPARNYFFLSRYNKNSRENANYGIHGLLQSYGRMVAKQGISHYATAHPGCKGKSNSAKPV